MEQIRQSLVLVLSLLIASTASAASGDTTIVRVQDAVDLTWYGSYTEWASFPDASRSFQSIDLDLTIGCSSNGCSHWDYDVDVEVGRPTGTFDSTIASIDTVSTAPIVLDTTWNAPFEVIEWYEIGRMITPYGNYMDWETNGYDANWTHTYTYDATDYRHLLTDSVPIRVFYHGWSDGFSATVDVRFIEGAPARPVLDLQNVFDGGTYTTSADFEANVLPPVSVPVPAGAASAELKVIITGHGQDGEFTPINYRILENGTQVGEEEIWRDDCGEVAVWPQGGTWIINRANWCPGDAVEVHRFDLTNRIADGMLDLDMDLDAYTPSNAASYSISGLLAFYGPDVRDHDVALDAIVAPSTDENFVRFNPICGAPIVRIRNEGTERLTECTIEYGAVGGTPAYHRWTGDLAMGETAVVKLPRFNWQGVDLSDPRFYAVASWPENFVDQFPHNDRMESSFELPPTYPNEILRIRFRTNDHPEENQYVLLNMSGDTVVFKSGLPPNNTDEETVLGLIDGCYTFRIEDYDAGWGGGDGLSWWFNQDQNLETAGWIELRDGITNGILHRPNPDFGSSATHRFLIGDALDEQTPVVTAPEPMHPEVVEVEFDGTTYWEIYDSIWVTETSIQRSASVINSVDDVQGVLDWHLRPNPTQGAVTVVLRDATQTGHIEVVDVLGRTVARRVVRGHLNEVRLDGVSSGTYVVRWMPTDAAASERLLVVE